MLQQMRALPGSALVVRGQELWPFPLAVVFTFVNAADGPPVDEDWYYGFRSTSAVPNEVLGAQ